MCWLPSDSTGVRCGELHTRQVVRVVRLVRGGPDTARARLASRARAPNLSPVTAAGDLPAPRSRARRIGGLVAALLVVAFLGLAVVDGWGRVSSYDWQFDARFFATAMLCLGASLTLTGVGYAMILERLAARRLPRARLLSIWSQSILARYVPGNVMMVAGRVVLGREAGVSGRVSLAASVYEQAFALGLGAVVSIGFLLYIGDLGQGPWLWVVAAVPLGLALLHPRVFGPLVNLVLRRIHREPLEVFLSPREVGLFTALYAVAYVLLAVGVWATVRTFAGSDAGDPVTVGSGFLLSFVVSMLVFVFPSGLGVREGIFALVLARELPGGVAIAAAALTRLVLTLAEVGFATVVVAWDRRRRGAQGRSTR
jgi:glycosyltransferase 2 family protein